MVNAFATIDLPWSGISPIAGFSASSGTNGTLSNTILDPSTLTPFAPKNEIIEQFWMYGDKVILGLVEDKPT